MTTVYVALYSSNEEEVERTRSIIAVSTNMETAKAQAKQYIDEELFGNYLSCDDMSLYEYHETEGVENELPWWEYEISSKTSNSFYRVTITKERLIVPAS